MWPLILVIAYFWYKAQQGNPAAQQTIASAQQTVATDPVWNLGPQINPATDSVLTSPPLISPGNPGTQLRFPVYRFGALAQ